MDTRRTLRQKLADLQRRYADAVTKRDAAERLARTELFNVKRLAGQLSQARDELDTLHRKIGADRPSPAAELRDARRALMLSERARRSLDEQLATVQAANEALCREAVDHAGNLAPEVTR